LKRRSKPAGATWPYQQTVITDGGKQSA